jgi:hypothetical protein
MPFSNDDQFTSSSVLSHIKQCLVILHYGLWTFLLSASCMGCRVVNVIPPKNLTETRLAVTNSRIEQYWEAHRRVPDRPDQLPVQKNRDCSMTDGWGRQLQWDSNGVSRVRVWSFGRDGIAGGTGEDTELETVFEGDAN